MKRLLPLVFLLLFPQVLWAAKPLSLSDCLKLALTQYPRLKALAAQRRAREALYQAAKKDLWPRLSLGYRYTRFRDRQKIVILGHDVPISAYEATEFDLSFEFPIFHGLSLRAKRNLSALQADVARVEEERGREEVAYLVKEAYYGLLTAERKRQAAKKSLTRLKAHLETARALYEEGLVARHQVLEAEVAVAEAEHRLVLAQNAVELARYRLNLLLGRDLSAPLTIEDTLEASPQVKDLSFYLTQARERRPELQAARLALEMARERIRLARAKYWPQVDFLGLYQKQGTDLLASQNPYLDRENVSFTLKVNFLLWDFGKRGDEVAAARAEALAKEASLRELEREVELEVRRAYLAFRAARKHLTLARKALSSARENFRLEKARFAEGLATTADVLDAEAFLARAELGLVEALSDLKLSYAALLLAVGEPPLPQGP